MLSLVMKLVFFYCFLHCGVTIRNGQIVTKRQEQFYRSMVYLVMSNLARPSVQYTTWTCGGALVTPRHIITSAACLKDVQRAYAIAGYKYHIRDHRILDKNHCTKWVKRRIDTFCVPIGYKFSYDNPSTWASNDIALAKLDSPYVLEDDQLYKTHECSYAPTVVRINFDKFLEKPANFNHAILNKTILGWGHWNFVHKPNSVHFGIKKELHYTQVQIISKVMCKQYFPSDFHYSIDNYMICGGWEKRDPLEPGFCQNDHGGPIFSYTDYQAHSIALIGVQTAMIETKGTNCTGPYLFTSTAANQKFLRCALSDEVEHSSSSDDCNEMNTRVLLKKRLHFNFDPFRKSKRNVTRRPIYKHYWGYPNGYQAQDTEESVGSKDQMPKTVYKNVPGSDIKIRPQIPISHLYP